MTRVEVIRKADKAVNAFVCLALILVLLFGCYSIWDTWQLLSGNASGSDLTHYKPTPGDATHQSIAQLQGRNPDVKAWLTVDGTGIDYPVLQGKDNFQYLNMDALGQYSLKGSLFLDYQCDPTFEACYELIHGHHMVDSMMFGDLEKFTSQDYFDAHTTGNLMTVDKTYKLESFACLKLNATDPYVYSTYKVSEASNRALLKYINNNSDIVMCSRDIGIKSSDQILALSTCASGQTGERTVYCYPQGRRL